MAGIKKGGLVGDAPKDFERPESAYEGVRMHVNHMAAYAHKRPIGEPHDRFYDARAAQKARGWWVRDRPARERDLGRNPQVRAQDPGPPD